MTAATAGKVDSGQCDVIVFSAGEERTGSDCWGKLLQNIQVHCKIKSTRRWSVPVMTP
jgi:hypothetical protein